MMRHLLNLSSGHYEALCVAVLAMLTTTIASAMLYAGALLITSGV